MRTIRSGLLLLAALAFVSGGIARAAQINVSANISVSQTWTADNTYNLTTQIYVLPGATLTIQAGVVVASTTNGGGSIAVCRGAKIYVNGTAQSPVIMTSLADVATWAVDGTNPTGHNPKTGTWREGLNEWGNLTLMGKALISASDFGGVPVPGNTKTPTGLNVKQMEGLTAAFPGDPNVIFGGNDDNDNSGAIHYLSLRYGGKVIGLGNELNGLSMGGIGRGTDVDHVEIMNNVDDGIETWGGTVNYKYISIWNVGDDGFDIDEGWRGKAQFGLIVQGYSGDAARGSGVSDNCFEMDGAEDADAQPVTTGAIYNFTAVGQPLSARGGTTWRDECRMQFRNCIFMNLGQQLVRFDNSDGDGAHGYGFGGTAAWPTLWNTAYTSHSAINAGTFTAGAFNDPAVLYQSQTSGKLCEISDSVFFQNVTAGAYTESDARGVTIGGSSNPTLHNVVPTTGSMPIQGLTRGAPVIKGGLTLLPVTNINPRAANDALTSFAAAPADGFFTPAPYRGGFDADHNWILGWTAAAAYGMTEPVQVNVSTNITTSTVWTADHTYNLTTQIYVLPGATLTIEAGVVVASTTNGGGSIAVTRGGKIFVNGTQQNPVIMTSLADVATWAADPGNPTGHNPKTGTWREGLNEWGNLTLMGKALISASDFGGVPVPGNTKTPTGLNVKQMEGLTAAFPGDPNVIFGGNDDNDDSGSIHYLSLRYGGKVIGLGNELNGLSMGGIGRGTDVDHVEIMNNVDDGIETWGGTVNYKYISIWNVGDDGFDIDEGWRGKAQFGLIVQGYSGDAARGSGVSDNCFEMDGAEDSDAQPVTTGAIYNFTAVGQPLSARGGTTWRDECRMQFRNCIFMNLGQQLVRFDNSDGDGAHGYGFGGTAAWPTLWNTAYTSHSAINAGTFTAGAFNDPAVLYQSQTSGNLCEISDSVFYQNITAGAYTESDARGVTVSGGSNPALHNIVATNSPIQGLTRGAPVTKGGLSVIPVTNINPRAANDSLTSFAAAPLDGFFTQAHYRGGFDADHNWLLGWTAAAAYGMTEATQVQVSTNITTSTVWTADHTYNLQNQIYVMPGATLTIEPGVVVASTTNGGGSIAVTRGGKIYVNGTQANPVIMTSLADVATWAPDDTNPTGHDPKTGNWREGVNEWGNLTLMGKALISASDFGGAPVPGNTKTPTGLNVKQMEGLTAAFPGDPNVIFGGNDDNDNSGAIHYLSLRYGGKVIGLGNELNGLSMGGIGRGTDVDHVEIMNNVDDGIETWGGTVNYKYISIWNVGDDGFDIDEGWRGKAQFGLIVQGYSADAARGSGVSDNCFEMDGAEDSDAQPVTTGVIYNFTAVGQPLSARGGTTWRDECRMQFRNCIFMNLGQQLVRFDNSDGDGAHGYGFGGTAAWPTLWNTPYTSHSLINAGTFTAGAFNDPAILYQSQTTGTLCEISDSVFYQNLTAGAYTEADARGVTVSGGSNPTRHNIVATTGSMPILGLMRGAPVTKGGLTVIPVTNIDPRAANDALTSYGAAPADGFFAPAHYRGGFNGTYNWLSDWTAAAAYGMTNTAVSPHNRVKGRDWAQYR